MPCVTPTWPPSSARSISRRGRCPTWPKPRWSVVSGKKLARASNWWWSRTARHRWCRLAASSTSSSKPLGIPQQHFIMQLLELNSVSKSYGALKVTDDLSFSLKKGEALGIIGPNGAGKTTLFNLVTGNVRPDAGTVMFNGRDVTSVSASVRCHLGMGRSYQVPHPFGGMTVFENVLVGATFGAGHSEHEGTPVALDALKRTGLLAKANRLAGSLPLLDRKRLG